MSTHERGVEAADLSYTVRYAHIEIDGNLDDWDQVPCIAAQTPFRGGSMPFQMPPLCRRRSTANVEGRLCGDARQAVGGGGPWTEFYEHNGGIWNGILDHSMAFAMAYDSEAVYLGVKVVDDTHQNLESSDSGWNGDSLQVAFTNAGRDAPAADMILYNYGLADTGTLETDHQQHPCADADDCTEAAILRVEEQHVTSYEIRFPAQSLGLDTLSAGMQFGFGMATNDGDSEEGQNGGKGWSGWGPYAIQSGKNSAACGLITLDHRLRPSSAGCPVVMQSKVGVARDPALSGCTDPRAANHDAAAVSNGGSCVYNCKMLAASGDDGDTGCMLVGGVSLDLLAPDLSVGTAPASLVIQGRVDLQTVLQQQRQAEGTGPYNYLGCFQDDAPANGPDSPGGRDMPYGPIALRFGIDTLDRRINTLAIGHLEECAILCGSGGRPPSEWEQPTQWGQTSPYT